MSESSSKRPANAPVAEPLRPEGKRAATAIETVLAAPALPPAQPAPAAAGNPAATPGPVALFDAFAHGAEAFADGMADLAQTSLANATDTASAMLRARTLTEAFEINAGFFRKSFDTMLTGSMRFTDITARFAEATLQPLMLRG